MNTTSIFLDKDHFQHWVKVAQTMAESSLGIPSEYQGSVGNCLNAIEISRRLNVSPIDVMRNLPNVGEQGRPAWSANFVRAMIDQSGRFSDELQLEVEGDPDDENYRVRAWATTHAGVRKNGSWITWPMAEIMGWTENVSWEAMPVRMFTNRAINAFGTEFCNSLLMGFLEDEGKVEPKNPGKKSAIAEAAGTGFAPFVDQLPTAQLPAANAPEQNQVGQAEVAKPMQKVVQTSTFEPTSTAPDLASTTNIADSMALALKQTETAQVPSAAPQGDGGTAQGPSTAPQGDGGVAPNEASKPQAEATPKVRKPRTPKATEAKGATPPPSLAPAATDAASASADAFAVGQEAAEQGSGDAQELPSLPEGASTGNAPGGSDNLARELDRAAAFSEAMLQIETSDASKDGIEAMIRLAESFGEPERVDLYGLAMSRVGSQIEKMVQAPGNLGEAQKAFLSAARALHASTKEMVAQNPEIAESRSRLGKAYTAMVNVVAALSQPAVK